jgi:hypothetical protein
VTRLSVAVTDMVLLPVVIWTQDSDARHQALARLARLIERIDLVADEYGHGHGKPPDF